MAPAQVLMSGVIFQEIVVAGVVVRALVDSGASTALAVPGNGIRSTRMK